MICSGEWKIAIMIYFFFIRGDSQEFNFPFPGDIPDGLEALKQLKLDNFVFHPQWAETWVNVWRMRQTRYLKIMSK
jgi:hypothetical protein